MEFSSIEAFEVRAEAFRLMTGHMAPGKDAAPGSYPADIDVRNEAHEAWWLKHGACVRAVMKAVENIVEREDDDVC